MTKRKQHVLRDRATGDKYLLIFLAAFSDVQIYFLEKY